MQQWNRVYKKDGKVFADFQKDMPSISRLFRRCKVRRILDLGCGYGRHVVYLAKKGFRVYGIDIAKEGLKIAKSWLKQEKLKANLKTGSMYGALPYPNDFFDAIISIRAVHHAKIEMVRKAIKEIKRVLKPNGIIFVSVPRKHSERFKLIAPDTCIPIVGKERGLVHYLFTKGSIKKEFEGFEIRDIWGDSGGYCFIGELKRR